MHCIDWLPESQVFERNHQQEGQVKIAPLPLTHSTVNMWAWHLRLFLQALTGCNRYLPCRCDSLTDSLLCRLEAAPGLTANLTHSVAHQGFSSGLVTGGTGSLGCLVARWLSPQKSAATTAQTSPLAAGPSAVAGPPPSAHPLQRSHERQTDAEPPQNGIAIELLGRSGRADAALRLLSSVAQLEALVTIRQCDAACKEDTAAALRQGCQVSLES